MASRSGDTRADPTRRRRPLPSGHPEEEAPVAPRTARTDRIPLTEDVVRGLAARRAGSAPVISCYLDVDGRRRPRFADVTRSLERMVRDAKARANGTPSVHRDLKRIEDHVRAGLDRSGVRGLAMFSCSDDSLWQVFALPVPVRDQLVVNHSPSVRQLEVVLDQHERFGMLLADRQRARMLVFELGELVESAERFDQLPRGDDDDHSVRRDRLKDHAAAHVAAHLRHAADVAFSVFQDRPFDRLVLGAPEDIAAELTAVLHPYLRSRLEARCSIPVTASDDEIRTAAAEVEADAERRKEAEVVDRLRDAVGAGRRGVAGLTATLAALGERRVDMLVVSAGYVTEGWRCGSCGALAAVGPRCPVCSSAMDEADDVVEEAIQEALTQSCRVEVCEDNADLDVMGRIGALLRY
jgi:peptide chain release factor subunit 1